MRKESEIDKYYNNHASKPLEGKETYRRYHSVSKYVKPNLDYYWHKKSVVKDISTKVYSINRTDLDQTLEKDSLNLNKLEKNIFKKPNKEIIHAEGIQKYKTPLKEIISAQKGSFSSIANTNKNFNTTLKTNLSSLILLTEKSSLHPPEAPTLKK